MLFYLLTNNNMGTGWLFEKVDTLFEDWLTWVGTLLDGWLWKIIVFLLAVALTYIVYKVARRFAGQ